MKSSRIPFLILLIVLATGCGGSGGSGSSSSGGGGNPPTTGNNVLAITVNGPGLNNSYPNEACVSVTICTPGTTTCQTINDILLDTGSSGLRIFKQALNVSLLQVTSGSGSLAECVPYADGSSDWGPVQMASVTLGNEPAVRVPIQVIDSTFGTFPSLCGTPDLTDLSPSAAGYNGILGLGLFVQDCGPECANSASNGRYYTCSGSNCTGTAVALDSQVQNPVALLPQDNNGVILQLPSVPLGGSPSVNGSLVLGIGTQSNNVPSGVTGYPADQLGEFTTTFNGTAYSSFIDSGSNGLFFPSPSASQLPNCSDNPDWFCPSSTGSLSATNEGASGSPSGSVSFQIGNFDTLFFNSSNNVFDDIGGSLPDGFDWGLPFFLGRNIYVGLEGKTSSLGTGPYWAY
jgi:hypothetical protein